MGLQIKNAVTSKRNPTNVPKCKQYTYIRMAVPLYVLLCYDIRAGVAVWMLVDIFHICTFCHWNVWHVCVTLNWSVVQSFLYIYHICMDCARGQIKTNKQTTDLQFELNSFWNQNSRCNMFNCLITVRQCASSRGLLFQHVGQTLCHMCGIWTVYDPYGQFYALPNYAAIQISCRTSHIHTPWRRYVFVRVELNFDCWKRICHILYTRTVACDRNVFSCAQSMCILMQNLLDNVDLCMN